MPAPTTPALDALHEHLAALPFDDVRPPKSPVHAILRQGRAMLDFALVKERAKTLEQVG